MKAKKTILGLFILAILIALTSQLVFSANSPVFIADFDLDDIASVNEDTQSDYQITGKIFPLNTQPVSDYDYNITNSPSNSEITTFTTATDVFINATFKNSGTQTFTLTVTDKVNSTYTHSRTISASVTATDSEAFFMNGTQTVATFNEDQYTSSTKQSIDLSTLIDNDEESDSITYSLISGSHNPQSIVCEISGSSLTYYPAKDFFGSATCGVQLTDVNATISATSRTTNLNPLQTTFNFNVNAQNDAPQYIATSEMQNLTFIEDTNSSFDLTQYFKDVDGDTLTYTETHGNGISKVTFSGDIVTIELVSGFDGLTTLVINAFDPSGENTTSGTLNINITGINNAVPQFVSPFPVLTFEESTSGISEGTTLNLSTVVTDQDTPFTQLTIDISQISVGLNVELVSPTSSVLNITSNAGFDGIGTFMLTVSDGVNANAKLVQVNVTGVNQAPSTPVLVSPENNSNIGVDNNLKVDLVWNSSIDLDSPSINYTVTIYPTSNSSDTNNITTTDTTWENVTVESEKEYTWYVDASDGEASVRSESFAFTPVTNFKPVIVSFTPDVSSITINEGESINFTTKVNDTEDDTLTYSWKLKGTQVSTKQNFSFYTGFNSSGIYDLVFMVSDGNNTVSREVNITVNDFKVLDIKSKTPSDNKLFMAQGTSQEFTVELNNTNNLPITYNWTLDGEQIPSTTNSYTHNAPSLTGTQNLKLTVSSILEGVAPVSEEWTIETRNTPVSRSGDIGGSITGFTETQLTVASGVTLERTDVAKIDFGNQIIDLRSVIDLDNFIVMEKNLVAIDSSTFGTLNKPATITLHNLAYTETPKIFRNGAFTRDGSSVTSECTNCNIVSFTPAPTSSGTVTFTVDGFSTYKVGNAVSPAEVGGLIIERFEIDGKRLNAEGGSTVRGIKPGDNVKIELKIKNNFDESNDPEIQDVEVEVFIVEIRKDRNNIELDSGIFDLKPRRSETVDFDFNVPTEVEDGKEYKIIIEVSGIDEENRDYNIRTEGFIRIDKDRHNVHIEEFDLTPEIVRCSRSISVDVEIKNRGGDRERDAVFKLVNSDLGINRKIEFTLDNDPDDNDFEYDQSLTFTLSEDIEEGDYEIVLETYYDETRLSNREVRTLTVAECQDRSLDTLVSGDDVVINVPDETTPLDKKNGRFSGISDEELLLIVVLGGIVLILLTLILIIVLMPKKDKNKRINNAKIKDNKINKNIDTNIDKKLRTNKKSINKRSTENINKINKNIKSSNKNNKKIKSDKNMKKEDIGEEQ